MSFLWWAKRTTFTCGFQRPDSAAQPVLDPPFAPITVQPDTGHGWELDSQSVVVSFSRLICPCSSVG